jgi:uncharacterized protein involved in response to NO
MTDMGLDASAFTMVVIRGGCMGPRQVTVRVAFGHTGRDLVVAPSVVLAYVAITVAAVARVAAHFPAAFTTAC